MTTRRRDQIAYLLIMFLFGLTAGYAIDTYGAGAAQLVNAYSCTAAANATINSCVVLDTSQVEDLRGTGS